MLGREGALNSIMMAMGIIDKPVSIFTFLGTCHDLRNGLSLFGVFAWDPSIFSMARIEEEVIESAQDLGAGGFQAFIHVIVPLSLPGVATGAFFVIVMVMGEYATPAIIGGNKFPMIGNNIMAQSLIMQWTPASAYSIILMGLTLIFVIILFRLINIQKLLR